MAHESDRSPLLLAVNGGSSSIKYALFDAAADPRKLGGGTAADLDPADAAGAADRVLQEVAALADLQRIAAVGHRIVHGGPHLLEHQLITDALLAELRRVQPIDLPHLPREIALVNAFRAALPQPLQAACFDTVFFRDLPPVAQRLAIPRRFADRGVRRYGFHGLSYTYLQQALAHSAGDSAAQGRVILAHLGAGASLAALQGGRPIDTTMAFTPLAGLVMATRPGDIDPGLLLYLLRSEHMSPEVAEHFFSTQCGMVGISGSTGDMQALLEKRGRDPAAAEAVESFCYAARKSIGSFAAALGGLDTLVFSGGIGEHAAALRAEICAGLEFLGLTLDPAANAGHAPLISAPSSRVSVRVIPTNEELVMARILAGLLTNRSAS